MGKILLNINVILNILKNPKRRLLLLGQTHHGRAELPQLLGCGLIQGLRRRHFGGTVAVRCKEMKDEKPFQSAAEPVNQHQGRAAVRSPVVEAALRGDALLHGAVDAGLSSFSGTFDHPHDGHKGHPNPQG